MQKYLEYPNIDFGTRYLVDSSGIIISAYTNKQMKCAYKAETYKRVVLTDESHKKHLLYIHRIIAYNFIKNPDNLPLINHKDENPDNNDVSNLEWCDFTYNNTYNNRHIKIGEKRRGCIPWNKGKLLRK